MLSLANTKYKANNNNDHYQRIKDPQKLRGEERRGEVSYDNDDDFGPWANNHPWETSSPQKFRSTNKIWQLTELMSPDEQNLHAKTSKFKSNKLIFNTNNPITTTTTMIPAATTTTTTTTTTIAALSKGKMALLQELNKFNRLMNIENKQVYKGYKGYNKGESDRMKKPFEEKEDNDMVNTIELKYQTIRNENEERKTLQMKNSGGNGSNNFMQNRMMSMPNIEDDNFQKEFKNLRFSIRKASEYTLFNNTDIQNAIKKPFLNDFPIEIEKKRPIHMKKRPIHMKKFLPVQQKSMNGILPDDIGNEMSSKVSCYHIPNKLIENMIQNGNQGNVNGLNLTNELKLDNPKNDSLKSPKSTPRVRNQLKNTTMSNNTSSGIGHINNGIGNMNNGLDHINSGITNRVNTEETIQLPSLNTLKDTLKQGYNKQYIGKSSITPMPVALTHGGISNNDGMHCLRSPSCNDQVEISKKSKNNGYKNSYYKYFTLEQAMHKSSMTSVLGSGTRRKEDSEKTRQTELQNTKEIIKLLRKIKLANISNTNAKVFLNQVSIDQPQVNTEPTQVDIDPSLDNTNPLQRHTDPLRDQIDSLQRQSEPFQDQIDPLKGHIDSLRGRIDPLRDQTEPLRGQIEPLQGQINSLQSQINPLRGNIDVIHGNLTSFHLKTDSVKQNLPQVFRKFDLIKGNIPSMQGNLSPKQGNMVDTSMKKSLYNIKTIHGHVDNEDGGKTSGDAGMPNGYYLQGKSQTKSLIYRIKRGEVGGKGERINQPLTEQYRHDDDEENVNFLKRFDHLMSQGDRPFIDKANSHRQFTEDRKLEQSPDYEQSRVREQTLDRESAKEREQAQGRESAKERDQAQRLEPAKGREQAQGCEQAQIQDQVQDQGRGLGSTPNSSNNPGGLSHRDHNGHDHHQKSHLEGPLPSIPYHIPSKSVPLIFQQPYDKPLLRAKDSIQDKEHDKGNVNGELEVESTPKLKRNDRVYTLKACTNPDEDLLENPSSKNLNSTSKNQDLSPLRPSFDPLSRHSQALNPYMGFKPKSIAACSSITITGTTGSTTSSLKYPIIEGNKLLNITQYKKMEIKLKPNKKLNYKLKATII